jgi:hypothetical protein
LASRGICSATAASRVHPSPRQRWSTPSMSRSRPAARGTGASYRTGSVGSWSGCSPG